MTPYQWESKASASVAESSRKLARFNRERAAMAHSESVRAMSHRASLQWRMRERSWIALAEDADRTAERAEADARRFSRLAQMAEA